MIGGDVLQRAAVIALRMHGAHEMAMKADLPMAMLIETAQAKRTACDIFDKVVLQYLCALGRRPIASRN